MGKEENLFKTYFLVNQKKFLNCVFEIFLVETTDPYLVHDYYFFSNFLRF